MDYQNLHLKNLIDLEKWQRVQDALAQATDMAIITVDFRGFPVTKHSGCTDFCTAIRNNPLTRKDCYKCDSRGGLEAARGNRPYIYLCHCNIVDVAVPIVVNEKYVGAVMIGQVLLEEGDDEAALEQILMCMDAEGRAQREQLYDAYERLPRMSYGRIVTITNMIFELINYILLEATSKNNLINTYEWMLQSGGSSSGIPASGRPTEDLTLESMVKLKDKVSYAILKKQMARAGETPVSVHYSIRPAMEYIHSHKNENVSMEQMAKLCHLSSSYFSRLFAKEMGETFSNYLARQKVEWAKQLLESTDNTISRIAEELGFNDDGYFIKVFKKYEGTTPANYRYFLDKR